MIWSIEKSDKTRQQEVSSPKHIGSLIVYKVDEVDSEKVTKMTMEMMDFGVLVSKKDKGKFLELNAKFEEILKEYEERGNMIH